jgi:NAD(P)-dependent dehydrogenase (short-subunit alcohol dehydrogenase family)
VVQGQQERAVNDLKNKTVFITGASRGIGREIALRFAQDGANIVVTGKTSDAHPKLSGTIHETVTGVEAAGGRGLAIQLDIRDESAVDKAATRRRDIWRDRRAGQQRQRDLDYRDHGYAS